jgi:CRP-like cAMP-binding protein
MDTESLISFLAGITPLSEDFKNEVINGIKPEFYKSHQIIQAEGQSENRLWYLRTGSARSYLYDEQGNEHTLKFWNENEIIFSYAGFWTVTAMEYIEILEDSYLDSFSYQNLDLLLSKYPETSVIIKSVVHKYIKKEYRYLVLLTFSAEERYRELKRSQPAIFKKAPLRMIASYLNISRETLSRIISKH